MEAYVRVQLKFLEEPGETAGPQEQIILDVKIDSETGELLGSHPLFGLYGAFNSAERFPFLLTSDGRIDFGAAEEPSSRYWQTNLRNRFIRDGELVTIEGDEEWVYRIAKLTTL